MQAGRGKPGKRDRGKSKEEAQRKQEALVGLEVRERAKGQKVDTVSPPLVAGLSPSALPLPAHHAQVVHEAGPMGPNVGRRTGQWLHTDLLAAVQLSDGAHHHMHSIKHQGSRQLRWAEVEWDREKAA